jgi:hypothetical protein
MGNTATYALSTLLGLLGLIFLFADAMKLAMSAAEDLARPMTEALPIVFVRFIGVCCARSARGCRASSARI